MLMKSSVSLSATVIFLLALGIACLPGSGDEDDRLSSRDRRGTREARAERDQLRTERAEARQDQGAGSRVLPIFGGSDEPEHAPDPTLTDAVAVAVPATVAPATQPTAAFMPTATPVMVATATAAPTSTPATQRTAAFMPTSTPATQPTATFMPTSTPIQSQPIQELGGSLVIAVYPPTSRSARSWMMDAFSANALVRPFAEPLLHTGRFDGSIGPGLATGWELSGDGRSWVFHLRQGVSFHRGWGEFTAHDVVHSASLLVRDDDLVFGSRTFRDLFGQTPGELRRNIIPIDDYTVQFNLSRPADLIQIASAQTGNFFIYSKTQWDAQGTAGYADLPVGTGPWQLETPNVESSSGIEYSRVPRHWRQSPSWSHMIMYGIPEDATRQAMALTGETFIAELPRDLHSHAADSGLVVLASELPSMQVGLIMGGIYSPSSTYHTRSEPHLDVRVREAINRAINREKINQVLFNGIGRPSPVWGYHPTQSGWNSRWSEQFNSRYQYDPERARHLLLESGWNGYSLKVIVSQLTGVPEMRDIALAAADYLREIGIDVHTDEMPWSRYRADFYLPGQTHGTIAPIRSFIGPTHNKLRVYNHTDGGLIRTVTDPRLDQLYLEAINSWDVNVQHNALREAGDIKFDQYAEVPLLWLPSQVVVDPQAIEQFIWPGNIRAPFSHTEYITSALSR